MEFVRDTNLILYLPLYELDGTIIRDKSAYGRSCLVTGALFQSRGRFFDGTDDQIDCGNMGQTLHTVEMWLNPLKQIATASPAEDMVRLSSAYGAAFGSTTGLLDNETLTILETSGGSGRRTCVANYNFEAQFYHIIFVWNIAQSRYDFYINGQLQTMVAAPAGHVPLITSDSFILARRELSSNTWGNIMCGEVRAYNRPLDFPEIQNNYLATRWRYQ
ncbi:MAG: LamG-like jellyroll fold domain-containing protein [Dehalococcoidales bacterium]|jgi:hypothetical protein